MTQTKILKIIFPFLFCCKREKKQDYVENKNMKWTIMHHVQLWNQNSDKHWKTWTTSHRIFIVIIYFYFYSTNNNNNEIW